MLALSRVAPTATLLVALIPIGVAPPLHPELRQRAVVRGDVIIPDEGSPAGLYAYVMAGVQADSVLIDESGRFSLSIANALCGPTELRIDTPPGVPRRYHRALVRLDSQPRWGLRRQVFTRTDTTSPLRILLVPTRVVIDGGTFAGTTLPVDIDAALSPAWERPRYWRVSRAARAGYGTPVAWPETEFPIPVALRARRGLRWADSAAFWRTARQLEADYGRSLFQPLADDPAAEEVGRIIVMVEPRTESAGLTFVTYSSIGEIYQSTVAVRSASALTDAPLVTHELMHALGFGHSSGWYSAAGPVYTNSARATASDVAYAQLLYRLRRAHIDHGPTHGILASSVEARPRISEPATQCAP